MTGRFCSVLIGWLMAGSGKTMRRERVGCPASRRYRDLVNFTSDAWQVAPHANLSDRTRPVHVNVTFLGGAFSIFGADGCAVCCGVCCGVGCRCGGGDAGFACCSLRHSNRCSRLSRGVQPLHCSLLRPWLRRTRWRDDCTFRVHELCCLVCGSGSASTLLLPHARLCFCRTAFRLGQSHRMEAGLGL